MVATASDSTVTSASPAAATTSPPSQHSRTVYQVGRRLPDKPLVTIQPSGTWAALNLFELWPYRELIYFLIWRDLKVRYKQTLIGVAWVVMQPLMMTIIFTVFLGKLARVPSDGIPYPLFVFAGLLPWTFFSGSVLTTSNSLVGNAHLITKVYFPRMIIPAATIGARLTDFFIAFVILAGLMAYYGVPLTKNLLMLPVLVAIVTLLALGFGMWISALNVKYRDVGLALPVLMQLWMFASPIIYPSSLVPGSWRSVYALNPIVGITEGVRSAVFGLPFDWWAILIATAITLVLLVYSAYSFRRRERIFADII